ncbi:hypothetical protein [Methylobacterium planeticum]|uniref:hypothetical protein n=1 Tax=Methylobacterium planeticum TaxID=2615211 RepID=UPI00177C9FF9|nr:hypothetical protein [Methylobacterium planeticum]
MPANKNLRAAQAALDEIDQDETADADVRIALLEKAGRAIFQAATARRSGKGRISAKT